MKIKTYRGLMADTEILEINLRTNTGKVGYRINKFQMIAQKMGTSQAEFVMKIFKNYNTIGGGTAATSTIDFSDQDLVAAGFLQAQTGETSPYFQTIVFDDEVFNQNIFITLKDEVGGDFCNYYLELEQVKLDDNQSTMATLQSIRSRYEMYQPAGPT